MKNEIFLSYSSNDSGLAKEIISYIEANGYDCFLAERDIGGGKHFAKDIVNVLNHCRLVVLLASAHSNNSEHVLNEIDICVEKGKTIVPFFIEEFEINDEFRYYLGRSQRIVAEENDLKEAFPRLLAAIQNAYPKKQQVMEECSEDLKVEVQKTKTVFEYDIDRGIMVNPEDRTRNISFRQDTFLNMMSGIYKEIKKISGSEEAGKVYFESGYDGGSNFGTRLKEMWDGNHMTINEKLHKWCEFDSMVGWGKFDTDIQVDEEQGTLSGTMSINECFFVDKKNNQRICEYIRGYCGGVMESLLGDVNVTLTCITCPIKNKFKSECVFNVELTMEELY